MRHLLLFLCGSLALSNLYAEEYAANTTVAAPQQSNVYYPNANTYPQQSQVVTPIRRSSSSNNMEQKWRDYQNYNVQPNSVNSDYYPVSNYNYYQNYGVPPPGQGAPPAYNTYAPNSYQTNTYVNPNYPNANTYPAANPNYTNPPNTYQVNPNYTTPPPPNTYPNTTYPSYNSPNNAYPNSNVNVPPNQSGYYSPSYAPPPGGYGIGPSQQQGAILRNFDQLRNKTLNSDQGSYQPRGQMTQTDKVKFRAIQQQEELMKRQLKQQEGLSR
ncbi:MAG: hypothetical protein WC222_06920 [Parachlamydiales bacterium]|jgi:hypothetical protein